jgi:hypothetical protein
MNNTSKTIVKKGFFRRLFDYIKAKKYENKVIERTVYKKDWDKIKWRYRIGKLTFLISFILLGKYLAYSRVLREAKIPKSDIEILKNNFEDLLFYKPDNNFEKFKEELITTNQNFFNLEFFKEGENTTDEKVILTKEIVKHLFSTLNIKDNNFHILKINPKTNMEELEEMPKDVQLIFKYF